MENIIFISKGEVNSIRGKNRIGKIHYMKNNMKKPNMRSKFWDRYLYSLIPLIILTIFLIGFDVIQSEGMEYIAGLIILIFMVLGSIFYLRTIILLFKEGRKGIGITLIFLFILLHGIGFLSAISIYLGYPKEKQKKKK